MHFINNRIEIYNLDWDTSFFGINSAKVVLKEPIKLEDIDIIIKEIDKLDAKFITINNENNDDNNNYMIQNICNIFLADVNIQFSKGIKKNNDTYENIIIENNVKENEEIINIASKSFIYSRFKNDPNLNRHDIYTEWVKNSFNKNDKYFCYYINNNKILGFILFSINIENKTSVIELIAVDNKGLGIGRKMMNNLENYLSNENILQINVGTQINNIVAQNFYVKCGFKHKTNNSIYHWWNEENK